MASKRLRKIRGRRIPPAAYFETPEETTYTYQRLRLFLRTLLYAGGLKGFCRDLRSELGPEMQAIVAPLALLPFDIEDDPEGTLTLLREALQACLEAAEGEILSLPGDAFSRNLDAVANTLSLSPAECRVLQLAAITAAEEGLSDALCYLGELNHAQAYRAIGRIVDLPAREIEAALSKNGILMASGLIALTPDRNKIPYKLNLVAGFADDLHVEYADPIELFSNYARPARPATLTEADFNHLAPDFTLIRRLLQRKGTERRTGLNILLHGPPGTGKTELARTLAVAAGLPIFEIAFETPGGLALQADDRLSRYRFAQALLKQRKECLVLFDEVEEVFHDTRNPLLMFLSGGRSSPGTNKGWVNDTLETNPAPSIWVANHIGHIDQAYLRRFTHVLEVAVPPLPVRRNIVNRYVAGTNIRPEWAERIAGIEQLSPAHIESAASAASVLTGSSPSEVEDAMERILKNKMLAAGLKWPMRAAASIGPSYDLRFLNTSIDLGRLITGMKQLRVVRACLYGPPGTGKSAMACHLSRELSVPLIRKLASDLLSPWVGVTEKQIAGMFEQARVEGAILLLDEADSFLQDRSCAYTSWEVTQVNELLTQMEAFEGIFICSTNLMSRLDPASLRRFDLKVEFRYLNTTQAWDFFNVCLTRAGVEPANADSAVRAELAALKHLTPGDYTVVLRQARALGTPMDASALLDGLKAEAAAKPNARRSSPGFIA